MCPGMEPKTTYLDGYCLNLTNLFIGQSNWYPVHSSYPSKEHLTFSVYLTSGHVGTPTRNYDTGVSAFCK